METQTISRIGASANPPRKLFYKINEVSKMTGLKAHVLRYWESEFTELAPEKDSSDQRRYRAKDIQTVMAIRKLLYEDRFTIKGAKKQLRKELPNFKNAELPTATARAKKSSGQQEMKLEIAAKAEEKPEPKVEAKVVEVAPAPMTAPTRVMRPDQSESLKSERLNAYKPVNLYKRAMTENLSLIKKEVNELMALLNA